MNMILNVLMGLVLGYVIGIGLAAAATFVLGLDELARFIAIGCGLLGAVMGPSIFGRYQDRLE